MSTFCLVVLPVTFFILPRTKKTDFLPKYFDCDTFFSLWRKKVDFLHRYLPGTGLSLPVMNSADFLFSIFVCDIFVSPKKKPTFSPKVLHVTDLSPLLMKNIPFRISSFACDTLFLPLWQRKLSAQTFWTWHISFSLLRKKSIFYLNTLPVTYFSVPVLKNVDILIFFYLRDFCLSL